MFKHLFLSYVYIYKVWQFLSVVLVYLFIRNVVCELTSLSSPQGQKAQRNLETTVRKKEDRYFIIINNITLYCPQNLTPATVRKKTQKRQVLHYIVTLITD